MSKPSNSSEPLIEIDTKQSWLSQHSDYLLGGLFGLISLDAFLFLMHGITAQSFAGYGLTSLVITLALAAFISIERLYGKQVSIS